MPEIPTPAHVLQALAPLWPPLFTALEWATQQTRAYFDVERVPVDRHLAPSLVRYQAKRSLAQLGHDAQEEAGEAYAFETLPNNGLSLSYRGDRSCSFSLRIILQGLSVDHHRCDWSPMERLSWRHDGPMHRMYSSEGGRVDARRRIKPSHPVAPARAPSLTRPLAAATAARGTVGLLSHSRHGRSTRQPSPVYKGTTA